MIKDANWITTESDTIDICPEFVKDFALSGKLRYATLNISAVGAYAAYINGERVGKFVLAPGCTAYRWRLQYQSYDITHMLSEDNHISVKVGKGWQKSRMTNLFTEVHQRPYALIAEIVLEYEDGSETVITDDGWTAYKSKTVFSDIWDGESYNACLSEECMGKAYVTEDISKDILILQEGENLSEHEVLYPVREFITPAGDRVIDFGQNIAGYVSFCIDTKRGEELVISHAETLDADGNFYNDNFRTAKATLSYICTDGRQSYKPEFTYFGFRYIRLDKCPEGVCADDFKAIAIYSDMKRLGYINTGHKGINQLYSNAIWSHRGNFTDVPTDCPQRDEREGWLGDAQVFCLAAGYNYNVDRFFRKWIHDVCVEQRAKGDVPNIVPDFAPVWGDKATTSAGWGDAITIVPWCMYELYGDKQILSDSFEAMKGWLRYIDGDTIEKNLWICSGDADNWRHFGDWLGIDAPEGSYKGASDDNIIASVFYAHSVSIVIKTGKVLGIDVSEYEELLDNIKKAFKRKFTEFKTQTEKVLVLYFDMVDDKIKVADALAEQIRDNGYGHSCGFLGTPYLLHALSRNGYTDLAYKLLLREEYPSWLYEVNKGATTIWEHWDGLKDDGTMWSTDMNSFNHYAYGAVIDWIYTVAAGIRTDENYPGFEKAIIAPEPCEILGWLDVSYDTPYGRIVSKWKYTGETIVYEIEAPVDSKLIIDSREYEVKKGSYVFYSSNKD